MSKTPSPNKKIKQLTSVEEFVDAVELDDVLILKLSAERSDNQTDDDDQELPQQLTQIMVRDNESTYEFRFITDVTSVDANYQVDAVVVYRKQFSFTTEEAIAQEFVERAALLTVWPYIRQSVSDLSARLRRKTVVLGLARQGKVRRFDEEDE